MKRFNFAQRKSASTSAEATTAVALLTAASLQLLNVWVDNCNGGSRQPNRKTASTVLLLVKDLE